MDKNLYAIDEIIDDIVKIENISTNEIVYVDKKVLPTNIEEGTILKFDLNKYSINKTKEEERRQQFRNRLNKLKGFNNE